MVAHGASRGLRTQGRREPGGRHFDPPLSLFNVSPSGLWEPVDVPPLAPWATFCRPPGSSTPVELQLRNTQVCAVGVVEGGGSDQHCPLSTTHYPLSTLLQRPHRPLLPVGVSAAFFMDAACRPCRLLGMCGEVRA